MENSIKKAKNIAGNYLGEPNGFDDYRVSAQAVGGRRGVAFVTAIAAAMSGKKIRSDVSVSAAVDEAATLWR